ncbi:hypothetical protein P9209_20505 [Prescottella defluvii]|nr:hypothetical protein P9209_20505 [Prescottella defluvii]
MTTTPTTRAVTDAFFGNFATGDIDAVKALFDQDIDFAVHGQPPHPMGRQP